MSILLGVLMLTLGPLAAIAAREAGATVGLAVLFGGGATVLVVLLARATGVLEVDEKERRP